MDTIFERMMFGNLSRVASFEATNREYEVEVYVEGLDIDAIDSISLSKELQEQWGTYIPKGKENASDGRIRSRKTSIYIKQGKWNYLGTEYTMTIKTTDPEGGDVESELSAEESTFKQFTHIADQGMVKTRYKIPFKYEELDLVAEVDAFKNDQGEYIPWVKIDIEYPEGYDVESHPFNYNDLPPILIPKDPSKVYVVTPEESKDSEVRKKVKQIYDKYFLKPNKHI